MRSVRCVASLRVLWLRVGVGVWGGGKGAGAGAAQEGSGRAAPQGAYLRLQGLAGPRAAALQRPCARALAHAALPAHPRPGAPAGASAEEVAGSPFVEALEEQGYEVLYMTDPLDEYVMQARAFAVNPKP